jgi:hypothetical protein
MEADNLKKLQELSELFSNGGAGAADLKKLSDLLSFIKLADSPQKLADEEKIA